MQVGASQIIYGVHMWRANFILSSMGSLLHKISILPTIQAYLSTFHEDGSDITSWVSSLNILMLGE